MQVSIKLKFILECRLQLLHFLDFPLRIAHLLHKGLNGSFAVILTVKLKVNVFVPEQAVIVESVLIFKLVYKVFIHGAQVFRPDHEDVTLVHVVIGLLV